MSIFVTTTNTGTLRAKARPRCSKKKIINLFYFILFIYLPFVMPTTPALEPIISMQKSGACPVIPNTVVLRYFSWPAKSMNVITLDEFLQIFAQSILP